MHSKIQIYILMLCCGLTAACHADPHGSGRPEPGLEFFAVAPDTVMEVLYSSSVRKLYANRWASTDPFHVVVDQRGTSQEQCIGGEGFTHWLRAISSVAIRMELHKKIDTDQGEWAHVQLRDMSRLEPNEMTLHIPSGDGEPVVLLFQERQFLVDINASVLRKVTGGCATLGARK